MAAVSTDKAAEDSSQSLVGQRASQRTARRSVKAYGIDYRGAILQGFRLMGTEGGAGGASAALVLNSSRLQVIDTKIFAGPGGQRIPGSDQVTGGRRGQRHGTDRRHERTMPKWRRGRSLPPMLDAGYDRDRGLCFPPWGQEPEAGVGRTG